MSEFHGFRCYKGKSEWKEIDFTKDKLVKPCKDWLKSEEQKPEEVKKGIMKKEKL